MNGWNQNTGETDHAQLMKWIRRLDVAQLFYVKRDSWEAYKANPDGRKAGYYMDTVHYCSMRQNGVL